MDASYFESLKGTHDLTLPDWGPYTKKYMGISHISSLEQGLRFDVSIFPGLYRRSLKIPNVTWESDYHPWACATDYSTFTTRHELIWKDQVYTDISFTAVDDRQRLVRIECVNNSAEIQNIVLHTLAYMSFPPLRAGSTEQIRPSRVSLPEGAVWIDGLAYASLELDHDHPKANLCTDGALRGEVRGHDSVDGTALGRGFGSSPADQVHYTINASHLEHPALLIRYRTESNTPAAVTLSGLIDAELNSTTPGQLETALFDLPSADGDLAISGSANGPIQIDGFAIAERPVLDQVSFDPVLWQSVPERRNPPNDRSLILKYGDVDTCYGLAWDDSLGTEVRQLVCRDLDAFMRYFVHNHVSETLSDGHPEADHYTNIFQRPIRLEPQSRKVFYALIANGTEEQVRKALNAFDPKAADNESVYTETRECAAAPPGNPSGDTHLLGQELLKSALMTNVVFPVRTRNRWIRHSAPGKWWDSLYTWDSGFIGLGYLEMDLKRAVENLNAYVTEPGEPGAAFIHHGSPVPVQFYLYQGLWNRTRSKEMLAHFYPRLRQYHRFLAGHDGGSTTRNLQSNLLRTWDYFYNSGGWDDYPPQRHVHRNKALIRSVTPMANTSHAIRTARILKAAAQILGEDGTEYDNDIRMFSDAIQQNAWDESSGYFGYVRHDDSGNAEEILRYDDGTNFNMGLDGVTPLVADICTDAQREAAIENLMTEGRMWCTSGLSTVDQRAPYFRNDGYWNGSIWMPHQWFFWKALLDCGRGEEAFRIASAALELWRHEVDASYLCFEHFIVQTGRGAGWHHFGGLSAPVLSWYAAYHRPGTVTGGHNFWADQENVSPECTSYEGRFCLLPGTSRDNATVMVCLKEGRSYTATLDGRPVDLLERVPGLLEIQIPYGRDSYRLSIAG